MFMSIPRSQIKKAKEKATVRPRTVGTWEPVPGQKDWFRVTISDSPLVGFVLCSFGFHWSGYVSIDGPGKTDILCDAGEQWASTKKHGRKREPVAEATIEMLRTLAELYDMGCRPNWAFGPYRHPLG